RQDRRDPVPRRRSQPGHPQARAAGARESLDREALPTSGPRQLDLLRDDPGRARRAIPPDRSGQRRSPAARRRRRRPRSRSPAAPLLHDAREALKGVSAPEQQAKIKAAIGDLAEVANRSKTIAADAQAIVAHIRKGNGSVGALVMDEQLYDDIQELARDLKHNP